MLKRTAKWGLKLAVMGGLLWFLYRHTDLQAFAQALQNFHWQFLPLIYALLFANSMLNSWKWQLLLAEDGIRLGLGTLLCSHLVGTFFNLFLPSSIGGDAYRVVDVARRGGSGTGAKSFAAVFAERLAGFLAMAVWGLIFSAIGWRFLEDKRVLLIPVVVFAGMSVVAGFVLQRTLLLRLWDTLGGRHLAKLDTFLRRFLDSIALYRTNRRLLGKVFLLSLVFQMVSIADIYAISRALGWTVPFALFCIFIPLITLGEALPISIFGIGVRDSLYVFFFTPPGVGATKEQALSMALVYVAITLVYSLIGGLVFLLRPAPPTPPAPPPDDVPQDATP